MAKARIPIPSETAASVLFRSDRTCCICRERGKPNQIHHIDEDPANNDPANLACCVSTAMRILRFEGVLDESSTRIRSFSIATIGMRGCRNVAIPQMASQRDTKLPNHRSLLVALDGQRNRKI